MRWFVLLLIVSSLTSAQTITSAANASIGITPGSLATAYSLGPPLASSTAATSEVPWPTALGGVTVIVQDRLGISRAAGLLYVSPTQINFQVPPTTATGAAQVIIRSGDIAVPAPVSIAAVAPALFSVDGPTIAAASAIRVAGPSVQNPIDVYKCTPGCNLVQIDPGIDAPVILSLYGSGIAGNAIVTIGSQQVPATYSGPQAVYPGLDQVNVPLPLALRGAGVVNVTVTVAGVVSNAVQISVQ